MTERPILFSGPMVRAILEGRKTQTRRVILEQPIDATAEVRRLTVPNKYGEWACYTEQGHHYGTRRCRQGEPGDRLWVRETAMLHGTHGGIRSDILYEADAQMLQYQRVGVEVKPFRPLRWTPSIHMPRWASRILLEVRAVRAERLQRITPADVFAEGVGEFVSQNPDVSSEMFARLWNSINEKRGFGWEKNPWVWVIEFRKLDS